MIKYLTTFNLGYLEFAKNNLINYINTVSTQEDTLVMSAMDEESYNEINFLIQNLNIKNECNISIKKNFIDSKKNADFNTPEFFSITHNKLNIIYEELQNSDNLHFFDSDVFFFKNPKNFILEKISKNDIVFQLDQPYTYHKNLYHNYVCTGNFSIKKNDRTINFIKTIIKNIKPNQNDQEVVFNYLNSKCENIKKFDDCKLDVFDPTFFQNGYDAFVGNWKDNPEKVCVHANHMIGKDKKINSLKSIGAWVI